MALGKTQGYSKIAKMKDNPQRNPKLFILKSMGLFNDQITAGESIISIRSRYDLVPSVMMSNCRFCIYSQIKFLKLK